MLTAEQFFEELHRRYKNPKSPRKLASSSRIILNPPWTKIMLGSPRSRENGFLVRMGREMGYKVESETGRVDQLWRDERGTNVVALEHENDWRTIDNELEKLSVVDAHLKVLMTYVKEEQHRWRPFKLAEKVKKHLEERREKSEFLLVVGNYLENWVCTEWVAFEFPTVFRISALPPKKSYHKN